MSAASAARRTDPDREVVVLEASGHAAYGLCGLPYYVSGVVDEPESLLAYPPDHFRSRRGIDLRLNTTATRLEPRRRVVYCRVDGRESPLHYDRLVVAAGGTPARPPALGLVDPGVHTVRRLEDAVRLRGLLDSGRVRRALVVGAGSIGLEMAEALTERGVHVVVAELARQVLPILDAPLAEAVAGEVRRHGVDLRLGAAVSGLRRDPRGLRADVDGEPTAVDIVVLASGLRAESTLAAAAGASTIRSGGLVVDDRMRTSLPDVYAAGDCAAVHHLVLGRPALVPLGPAANKTGRVAGTVAAGGDARFPGLVGTAVVKVFDLAVARTGLTLAEALAEGLPAVATDAVGRSRAKYYPGAAPVSVRLVHERDGRLLGAQMVGADEGVAKRIDAAAVALQAGLDVDAVAALDLSYAPPYAPVYEPLLLAAQKAARASARVATTGEEAATSGLRGR